MRWISKTEQMTVRIQPPPPPPSQYTYPYSASSQLPAGYPQPPSFTPSSSSVTGYYTPPPQYGAMAATSPQMTFIHHQYSQSHGTSSSTSAWPQAVTQQPLLPSEPIERIETVARNYVVHENGQDEDATRPLWKETMQAMFGDHVNWEELKVYTGRGRPMRTLLCQSLPIF